MRDERRVRRSEDLERAPKRRRERRGIHPASRNRAAGRGLEEEAPPAPRQLARPAHRGLDARLPPHVARREYDRTLPEWPLPPPLAFVGLSSGTLALFTALTTLSVRIVLLVLVAGVAWLGWVVGDDA